MLYSQLFLEAKEHCGEDAPPIVSEHMLAVLDGLCGKGAFRINSVDEFNGCTNAYAASRICAGALRKLCTPDYVAEFFAGLDAPENDGQAILAETAQEIGEALHDAMDTWKRENATYPTIPSGLQVLPTTLAAFFLREREDEVDAVAFWAGDSRCYALTEEGLQQVSTDDLVGNPDYQTLLYQDCPMANNVNLTKPFTVSARRCSVKKPCALLTMTDGCFMYIPSPKPCALSLEYTLLWLFATKNAGDLAEGMEILQGLLGNIAQDDCAMTIAVFGVDTFGEMKAFVRKRYREFCDAYVKDWTNVDKMPGEQKEYNDLMKEIGKAKEAYYDELLPMLQQILEENAEQLAGWAVVDELNLEIRQLEEEALRAESELEQTIRQSGETMEAILRANWAAVLGITSPDYGGYQKTLSGEERKKIRREIKETCRQYVLSKRIAKAKQNVASAAQALNNLCGGLQENARKYQALSQGSATDGLIRPQENEKPERLRMIRLGVLSIRLWYWGMRVRSLSRAFDKTTASLSAMIQGRPAAVLEQALGDDALRARFTAEIPELMPCCAQYDEAAAKLQDTKDQLVLDVEGKRKTEHQRILENNKELLQWLESHAYQSGEKAAAYLDMRRRIDDLNERITVFDRQWKEYRKQYEALFACPMVTSGKI